MAAAAHLMAQAGARRIRILESPWLTAERWRNTCCEANWDPRLILDAAPIVEFENTNYLGHGKKYSRLKVPFGGYIYPAFDLNHSYEDCDVFVSIAKMKEHATAGVTLSMKNCFGITPAPSTGRARAWTSLRSRRRAAAPWCTPASASPPRARRRKRTPTPRAQDTYRVPRTVVDLISARPIHLAIVDGIKTMTGGEGPWIREQLTAVSPGSADSRHAIR